MGGVALVVAAIPLALHIAGSPGKSERVPAPLLEDIVITPRTNPSEVSQRVSEVLPAKDGPGDLARIESLRRMGDDLSSDECEVLLAAMLDQRDPSAPEGPHSVWFHEAALVLRQQAGVREKFARTLATVARDTRRDPVIRDYAIQHLRHAWELSDPALAMAIRDTLFDVADQSPSMAPSALLALHLLGSNTAAAPAVRHATPSAVPDDEISGHVRALLTGGRADTTIAKMTALRIVGDRRLAGFRDDLTRIAAGAAADHALVRMAAISAIARSGDSGDRALLESFDRSDPRVATAIDHAIALLESSP